MTRARSSPRVGRRLYWPASSRRERHADRLEILQPRVGIHQRLAHQDLVGDAVVAGDDLMQDAVEVVIRQHHDGPGVGERGVAGAADQPGIAERDAGAGRRRGAWRTARRPGRPPPRRSPARRCRSARRRDRSLPSSLPRPRPVLDRRMHVDDVLGAKISQLKQVMQCSRNLMTGSSLVCVSPATSVTDRRPAPCGSRRPGRPRRRCRSRCISRSRCFRSCRFIANAALPRQWSGRIGRRFRTIRPRIARRRAVRGPWPRGRAP